MRTARCLTTAPASALAAAVLLVLAACLLAAAVAGPARAASRFAWVDTRDPSSDSDWLALSALGPGGTLYAAGDFAVTSVLDSDIWVTKYLPGSSTPAWSCTWAGGAGGQDTASDIAVDATGRVYVAGYAARDDTTYEALVLCYDQQGTLIWQRDYQPSDALDCFAVAIGLDAHGSVYVAGNITYTGSPDQIFFDKLDGTTGDLVWETRYTSSGDAEIYDLAVTPAGDCYAVGTEGDAARDALLVKADAGGAVQWHQTWSGSSHADVWSRVEPARGGGVIVAGGVNVRGAGDIAVARYSASGARDWVHRWGAAGGSDDMANDLAVDAAGGVWVAGGSSVGNGFSAVICKWRPSGKLLFSRHLSGTGLTWYSAITTDRAGNAYVGGNCEVVRGQNEDALVAKYSASGVRRWKATADFNKGTKSSDWLETICLGPSGYLYACGWIGANKHDGASFVMKIRR
jgi:hypothetical protein